MNLPSDQQRGSAVDDELGDVTRALEAGRDVRFCGHVRHVATSSGLVPHAGCSARMLRRMRSCWRRTSSSGSTSPSSANAWPSHSLDQ